MGMRMSGVRVGSRCSVWFLCCCAVALWGNVSQGYFIDTFGGPGFDPRWTIESDTGAGQAPGFLSGGTVRFTNTFDHKFTLLRTPIEAVTNFVVQADVRNDDTSQSWAPCVAVYFSPTNYVALKLAPFGAGSQLGLFTHLADNGDPSITTATEVTPASLQYSMNTLRITFDAGQIQFAVERQGIDPSFVLLNSLTVARPADFFGAAQFILGKGFSSTSYSNPDFNNSSASTAAGGVNIIDNAMYIPEPGCLSLLVAGCLVLWARPRQ